MCVNFDFIEFGGMTQRKFWYGLWCHSTSFNSINVMIQYFLLSLFGHISYTVVIAQLQVAESSRF